MFKVYIGNEISKLVLSFSLIPFVIFFSVNFVEAWHITGHLPNITDPNLRVEEIGQGLSSFPTQMEFIDVDNLLVTTQNGEVYHILNGSLQSEPVLKVPVNDTLERGLVGMAIMKDQRHSDNALSNNISKIYVFFYYTNATNDR